MIVALTPVSADEGIDQRAEFPSAVENTTMTVYVALLRAINVGGSGKLPMKKLSDLCTDLGFENVRTYIQSGNVVFASRNGEVAVRQALEAALTKTLGKPADVAVRSAAEMAAVLAANPFPQAAPAKVGVAFLNRSLTKSALKDVVTAGKEEVVLGRREAYIHFPDGMGRSKLKLPKAFGPATVRNINTVGKLAAMAAGEQGISGRRTPR
jgi:uncharacterized protein (DUF1697 family)